MELHGIIPLPDRSRIFYVQKIVRFSRKAAKKQRSKEAEEMLRESNLSYKIYINALSINLFSYASLLLCSFAGNIYL
jgi:hypothetical protein